MNDKKFLQLAVEQAKESVQAGGFPAGSIVVKDVKIIAKGVSVGNVLNDPTSHAETVSIREACQKLDTLDLSGATLYASLQPCLMCFSVANWAGITRIVYGCRKAKGMTKKNYYEGRTDIAKVNQQNNRQIKLIYMPDFEEEMLELVGRWEEKNGIK